MVSSSSTPDTTSAECSQESISVNMCGTSERCRVLVRLRPLPTNEKVTPYRILDNPERVLVDTAATNRTPVKKCRQGTDEDPNCFVFDKIFPRESTQEEVFQTVLGDSVDSVLAGFNATVLAYGQTGAGKTYNMFGGGDEETRGLVPRALDALFAQVDKDESGSTYVIKLSMMEIYLEELRDLLRPVVFSRLKLRESSFDGVWVEGLHHVCVPSSAAALELVLKGMGNRTTGATHMNDVSSRSHCIVSLRVEKTMPDGVLQTGVLHFADLAGMERVDRTGAHGQSLEEAKRINLSLSALGNCIAALSQPNRHHIPFRDAKLTFLLKNSLGGNAKTTLLIAVSPRFRDLDETLGAFRFGQRARSVKNVVSVNRKLSPHELQRLLDKLQQEHRTLQDYCISLEERISDLTGAKKSRMGVDASTCVGDANISLNPNMSLNHSLLYQSCMGTAAAMRGSLLAPMAIPPNLPMSPAVKRNSGGMVLSPCSKRTSIGMLSPCSPVHDMDPMMLLLKVSVLEAEKRDMVLEIEALSRRTQDRLTVAGTSLSRDVSRDLSGENSDVETSTSTVDAPLACRPLEAVSTMCCQGNQTEQDNDFSLSLDQSNQTGADDSTQRGLHGAHAGVQDASCHARCEVQNASSREYAGNDGSSHQAFEGHEAATQMSPVRCTSMGTQSKQPLKGTLRKRGRSVLGLMQSVSCEITRSSLFYETALVGVRKEIQLDRVQSVCALKRSGFSLVTGQSGDLNSRQGSGGMRTFIFRAESDKQRDVWLKAIRECGTWATGGKNG